MANSTMAPLLFYLFVVVVFFILLSMFIAIIDDAFAFVKVRPQSDRLSSRGFDCHLPRT